MIQKLYNLCTCNEYTNTILLHHGCTESIQYIVVEDKVHNVTSQRFVKNVFCNENLDKYPK